MRRGSFVPPLLRCWFEAQKRERVRCSSLVDWSVYPSLMRNMQALDIRVEQMIIALAYAQPLDM
jgi:hypothetical protein